MTIFDRVSAGDVGAVFIDRTAQISEKVIIAV